MVKRASRNSRVSKASAHIETDSEGNDILLEFKSMVYSKIRGLWPKTDNWLVERLSYVIMKRRQQFCYQRHHERRRSKRPNQTFDSTNVVVQQRVSNIGGAKATTEGHRFEKSTPEQIELDEQREPRAPAAGEATAKTYSSTASHLTRDPVQSPKQGIRPTLTELRLKEGVFPNLPQKGEYGTFQCTQCFQTLPDKLRNNESWR
jgi:hypothetical protein